LRGDIKEGDFAQLKSQFRGKEAIVGFDLSSDGGVLEEGLRIADFTRRKELTVYVSSQCYSVCADVFLLRRNAILERIHRSVFMLFLIIEKSKMSAPKFLTIKCAQSASRRESIDRFAKFVGEASDRFALPARWVRAVIHPS
jgi:hypothetical protein